MSAAITVDELRSRAASVQMVDVRSATEYAAGHIPGTTNIPLDEIEARVDDLRRDIPVVLICQAGKRARMAAGLLEPCRREMFVLEGGTEAWVQVGLPLVASVKTRWSLERQVRLGAGLMVATGVVLGLTWNTLWLGLSAFVGCGLVFAGATDICPMAEVLRRMPWNGRSHCPGTSSEVEPTGCCK
ncbi:MAG TPA: rhodanese-like domain-containing protein [Candidatus Solibacter sp.]|nr:rhodanese-like domain-containing protein [Candidatus Solibacter sp.]